MLASKAESRYEELRHVVKDAENHWIWRAALLDDHRPRDLVVQLGFVLGLRSLDRRDEPEERLPFVRAVLRDRENGGVLVRHRFHCVLLLERKDTNRRERVVRNHLRMSAIIPPFEIKRTDVL